MEYRFIIGQKVRHIKTGQEGTVRGLMITDNGKNPAYNIRVNDGALTRWTESHIVNNQKNKPRSWKINHDIDVGGEYYEYLKTTMSHASNNILGNYIYWNGIEFSHEMIPHGMIKEELPETKEEFKKIVDEILGKGNSRSIYKYKVGDRVYRGKKGKVDYSEATITKAYRHNKDPYYSVKDLTVDISPSGWDELNIRGLVEKTNKERKKSTKWKDGSKYKCIDADTVFGNFTKDKIYTVKYDKGAERVKIICDKGDTWDLYKDQNNFQEIVKEKTVPKDKPVSFSSYESGDYITIKSYDECKELISNWYNDEIPDGWGVNSIDVATLWSNTHKIDRIKDANTVYIKTKLRDYEIPFNIVDLGTQESSPSDPWEATWGDGDPIPKKTTGVSEWDLTTPEPEKPKDKVYIDKPIKDEIKQMLPVFPVLLEGPVGSGKTTIATEVCEELGLELLGEVMTRQTTLSMLMGYKNVNGDYIPSKLRDAYENGKFYLLEELNGGDPNTLLAINTIENGFLFFPDGKVMQHPNFRMMATMNDITNAKDFGGRSNLDKSTENRFHKIFVPANPKSRFSKESVKIASEIDKLFSQNGVSSMTTNRDIMRFEHMCKAEEPEMALKKCLVNNKLFVTTKQLETIIKESKDWE